jgi:hypothetical protein
MWPFLLVICNPVAPGARVPSQVCKYMACVKPPVPLLQRMIISPIHDPTAVRAGAWTQCAEGSFSMRCPSHSTLLAGPAMQATPTPSRMPSWNGKARLRLPGFGTRWPVLPGKWRGDFEGEGSDWMRQPQQGFGCLLIVVPLVDLRQARGDHSGPWSLGWKHGPVGIGYTSAIPPGRSKGWRRYASNRESESVVSLLVLVTAITPA